MNININETRIIVYDLQSNVNFFLISNNETVYKTETISSNKICVPTPGILLFHLLPYLI